MYKCTMNILPPLKISSCEMEAAFFLSLTIKLLYCILVKVMKT